MQVNMISILLLSGLIFTGQLKAQGKYLNPAAQREMDKPIITASSTLAPSSSSNFSPDNLMDGSEASWSEGAKGSGIGEYLQVDFKYPDELKYVMIKNGFGKEKYWKANARIRKIHVSNEEGDSRVIFFEDTPEPQVVGLNLIRENENQVMAAGGGLYGSSFRFEILEVYPGERWQDACITEMDFNQWHTGMFSMSDVYIYKNLFKIYLDGVFDETGTLFIESEWAGYVELPVDDSHHFERLESGDGTEGHKEYQIFINPLKDEYYLFYSSYISQLDFENIVTDEEGQDRPARVDQFHWQFMVYDSFGMQFNVKDFTSLLDDMFDINPLKVLSEGAGKDIQLEETWITLDERGYIKFVYPQAFNFHEGEAFYKWDGSRFILEE